MPQEGEHDMDDELPTETKTMSFEGEFYFILDMYSTVHYNSDFAIEEMEVTYELKLLADFSAENIPDQDYDYEEGTVTVEYQDMSGSIEADISLQLDMEFDPALDIFDFPITPYDSWKAKSTMTASGSYEGEIDIDDDDMPEEVQKAVEHIEVELGEEFPIKLEELDTDDVDGIDHGEIEEVEEEIELYMVCTGTREVPLHDGGTTEAYVIEADDRGYYPLAGLQQDSAVRSMYSDEAGFIVSQEIDMGDEVGEPGMPSSMQMESMEPDEARESKEQTIDDVESSMEGEGWLEKLLSPPFLYVLIGVIAAVVIVGVFVGKRKAGEDEETPYEPGLGPGPASQPPGQQQWQQPTQQQQPPEQQQPSQQQTRPGQQPPEQQQPSQQQTRPGQQPPEQQSHQCPDCGESIRYVEKYERWYCDACQEYK